LKDENVSITDMDSMDLNLLQTIASHCDIFFKEDDLSKVF